MKHQTKSMTMADGVSLFTQSWLPDQPAKGTLVLVHGYAEHSGRYGHVADYFVQQGYNVYALDHRGHGQSRGETFGYFERFDLFVSDLYQYVQSIRVIHPTGPLFMIGHSMGGLIALSYAIQYQSTLKGLVTSGALLDAGIGTPGIQVALTKLLSRVAPKLGILPVDSGTISKDPAVVKAYDNDPNVFRGRLRARTGSEFIRTAQSVRANLSRITLPILILHGAADRLVSPTCAPVIYNGVGSADKTMKVYEGLHHEIYNEPEQARVLADVWVWLASHQGTGALPTATASSRRS